MSDAVLTVQGLRKVFRCRGLAKGGEVVALDGVSFAVNRRECLGLLGESGSGKTTTAKVILGLEVPDEGEVKLAGEDIAGPRAPGRTNTKIQMVFQDPYEALNPGLRIREIVAEPLVAQRRRLARAERESLVSEALQSVDLSPAQEYLSRYPHQLSGGQRQRVAIARALVASPEFIVADEPTSMLDVSVRAGILKVLKKLQAERRLSLLFITHDWTVARVMCDTVAVMYAGRIVEQGPTEELICRGLHPYTRALVQAVTDLKGFWAHTEKYVVEAAEVARHGCRFHPCCPAAGDICRERQPDLRAVGERRWVSCHLA
jgi:oligopeptide/dipeptide ABC transporter ATP-binding protein